MKRITVYADFDFLSAPQEVGTLGYEHVRGKDHFVFGYSRQWLKQHGGILLSGDLINVPSLQHPRGDDNVFSFVKDSFPENHILFVGMNYKKKLLLHYSVLCPFFLIKQTVFCPYF